MTLNAASFAFKGNWTGVDLEQLSWELNKNLTLITKSFHNEHEQ